MNASIGFQVKNQFDANRSTFHVSEMKYQDFYGLWLDVD